MGAACPPPPTTTSTSTTTSTASSCTDGIKNGDETDIDCGGSCPNKCTLTKACSVNADCVSASCNAGICRCPSTIHTFSITSNTGGSADSAEWPGGNQTLNATSECNVSIRNPSGNIDIVGALGDNFAVLGWNGFSLCFGNGGSDGNGCTVTSCPPAGSGSCTATRPSCSAALNGSGSATYRVVCNP